MTYEYDAINPSSYELALEEMLVELQIRRYKENFKISIAQVGERYYIGQRELYLQRRDTLDLVINHVSALYARISR